MKAATAPDAATAYSWITPPSRSQRPTRYWPASPPCADAFAVGVAPVCLYRFSYVRSSMREQSRAGTPRGGEIAYVFGTLSAGRGDRRTPQDQAVARRAQSYWVNSTKHAQGSAHEDA
ncbi:MAG: carboxylesterase family protein [Phycisphaerae bacterium]|nr:carboxylesterase family protein [Phycisphaerae bacterium]